MTPERPPTDIFGRGLQGPWAKDRYSELDLCLAMRRWSNSVIDVESDHVTNVNTDHLALIVKIRQKLKAKEEGERTVSFRGAKAESEDQTNEYNSIVQKGIEEGKAENMGDYMKLISEAAEEKLTLRPPGNKKGDCHPELERIIKERKEALLRDDAEEVIRITKHLKKRARKIRTESRIQKLREADWDPIKAEKKDYA